MELKSAMQPTVAGSVCLHVFGKQEITILSDLPVPTVM